jgi:hypothetical protein
MPVNPGILRQHEFDVDECDGLPRRGFDRVLRGTGQRDEQQDAGDAHLICEVH